MHRVAPTHPPGLRPVKEKRQAMKDRNAVRKVGQWGKSCALRLSPAEQHTLGVKPGDGVYVVITDDRTVELQPLAPPTTGARRRRFLSNRVRAVERQRARLRAKADASYQAGFNDGFDKGVMWALQGTFLTLERVAPKLERFLETVELGMSPDGSDRHASSRR